VQYPSRRGSQPTKNKQRSQILFI